MGGAEMTAERFLPDQYGEQEGGRMYRTGDKVRWREEGEIQYIGRVDQQVKVRGYRVEPGEIETVLAAHKTVQEAVIVLKENNGEAQLVGYVVGREGEQVSVSDLKKHLSE